MEIPLHHKYIMTTDGRGLHMPSKLQYCVPVKALCYQMNNYDQTW